MPPADIAAGCWQTYQNKTGAEALSYLKVKIREHRIVLAVRQISFASVSNWDVLQRMSGCHAPAVA